MTMGAVVRHSYGPAESLRLHQVARPSVAGHDVLIRVGAAGLDRGTWHLMTGKPYLLRLVFGLRRPRNPVIGLDVAGTVVSVGDDVTSFEVGDEVYGFSGGSFAEYAVAEDTKLAGKPSGTSFAEAAVLPVSAVTALQALVEVGRVRSGDEVLVIGASGGVGSYAVQLAKAFGATVTGVCSTAKVDFVRSLGVDHVIDYTTADFATGAGRYDLVLDIGGNAGLVRLRKVLTPTGTAVLVGGEDGDSLTGGLGRMLRAMLLSVVVRQRFATFVARQRTADLDRITELVESGRLRPIVDATFPLSQVPAAMRHLEEGRIKGKVAIVV